jgi:hypothetical protein
VAAKDDFLLETMLDMGLTTHEAVEEVRPEAESSGEGVVDTLVKTGRLEASLVVMAKSTYFGVEMVNLSETRLTDEVINAVPRHVARKYNAVPVAEQDGTVVVALSGRNLPVLAGEAYFWYADYQNPGVAAAYAVLILLVSVAATLFYLRALRVREEVYG